MTIAVTEVAGQILERFPGAISEAGDHGIVVKSESLYKVAEYLKSSPQFSFEYLSSITAIDYLDYFELVYQLVSLTYNHGLILRTRCYDRDNAAVPSVIGLWRGADYQEREICDLMGIKFVGHPNLKRMVLWEGFEGHPLRKDYLG